MASLFGVALLGALASAPNVPGYLLSSIDPSEVRLGGEIGRRIDITVKNNLLQLDLEKDFLEPFRRRDAPEGFIGLGMLLDSVVRLAHHTNDAQLLAKKEFLVRETIKTQDPDGYIGMMKPEARLRKLWDVHEMSYLVIGLSNEARLFQDEAALSAAQKLGGYLLTHLRETPPPGVYDGTLNPEMPSTGLADAFMLLSDVTGDPSYRAFCLETLKVEAFDKPIVRGRHGNIDGHIYAYIDKCLVQLRRDPARQRPELHATSDNVLRFLLNGDGVTVSGGSGEHECWQDTQAGLANHAETCASVYLLRFYDEMLRQTGDARYADLIERTVYNTLFAAQSPDGRHLRYYSSFEGPRRYFDGDTYCCPDNYRRGIADLPGYMVYVNEAGLLVSQYTAGRVKARLRDHTAVVLKTETAYPSKGDIRIVVSPAKERAFTLALRLPRWCPNPTIAVNGVPCTDSLAPGTYAAIHRTWAPGDAVTLNLPMQPRFVKGRRSQEGRAVVLCGPLVFGLNPERNPELKNADPRLIAIDTASLEGPFADDSVRPGGIACKLGAWNAEVFYPGAHSFTLNLTEFTDPGLHAAYFFLPDPLDGTVVDDEILGSGNPR